MIQLDHKVLTLSHMNRTHDPDTFNINYTIGDLDANLQCTIDPDGVDVKIIDAVTGETFPLDSDNHQFAMGFFTDQVSPTLKTAIDTIE